MLHRYPLNLVGVHPRNSRPEFFHTSNVVLGLGHRIRPLWESIEVQMTYEVNPPQLVQRLQRNGRVDRAEHQPVLRGQSRVAIV